MLSKLSPYKATLLLTSAIGLMEMFFVGFLYFRGYPADDLSLVRSTISVAIVVGLWLISNIARYLGAAWYAAIAVMVVYEAAINEHIDNKFSTYWVFALGLMCIAAVCLLVVSKDFAAEFRALRETRPAWKATLGRLTTVVLVTWVVIATGIDIYRVIRHVVS
jgi:hypothetical protein